MTHKLFTGKFWFGAWSSDKDERKLKPKQKEAIAEVPDVREKVIVEPTKPKPYKSFAKMNKQLDEIAEIDDLENISDDFYKVYKKSLRSYANNPNEAGSEEAINALQDLIPPTPKSARQIYKVFRYDADIEAVDTFLINKYVELVEKGLEDEKAHLLWQDNVKVLNKAKKNIDMMVDHSNELEQQKLKELDKKIDTKLKAVPVTAENLTRAYKIYYKASSGSQTEQNMMTHYADLLEKGFNNDAILDSWKNDTAVLKKIKKQVGKFIHHEEDDVDPRLIDIKGNIKEILRSPKITSEEFLESLKQRKKTSINPE